MGPYQRTRLEQICIILSNTKLFFLERQSAIYDWSRAKLRERSLAPLSCSTHYFSEFFLRKYFWSWRNIERVKMNFKIWMMIFLGVIECRTRGKCLKLRVWESIYWKRPNPPYYMNIAENLFENLFFWISS